MSHAPEKSRPVSRPHGQKLDKQLETLDRSHQQRQNSKAVVHKMTTPKQPKR